MADADHITPIKRIHDEILDRVLAAWPEAKTGGFMRGLRALPDAHYVPSLLRTDREWAQAINFVPDAWLIEPERRDVVIFEAVHRHDVPEAKFAKMADLSWALDEDYYTLVLVRCDRFCRRAYHVQAASLCSELERATANLPSLGWVVPDWQRYDSRYTLREFEKFSA
jgi:hypothetical protein